jgi:hypothetical protein
MVSMISPTAAGPAVSPRPLALVPVSPHSAPADRERALTRVRRARRHVESEHRRSRVERFAYLKRVYD